MVNRFDQFGALVGKPGRHLAPHLLNFEIFEGSEPELKSLLFGL
jgi:hypothetical protein